MLLNPCIHFILHSDIHNYFDCVREKRKLVEYVATFLQIENQVINNDCIFLRVHNYVHVRALDS